jgi:hypothetical protein
VSRRSRVSALGRRGELGRSGGRPVVDLGVGGSAQGVSVVGPCRDHQARAVVGFGPAGAEDVDFPSSLSAEVTAAVAAGDVPAGTA